MENEILEKLKIQEAKLDAILKSTEKIRKIFLIILWGSIIAFVLPLIGLVIVIPQFIHSYLGSFQGLL